MTYNTPVILTRTKFIRKTKELFNAILILLINLFFFYNENRCSLLLFNKGCVTGVTSMDNILVLQVYFFSDAVGHDFSLMSSNAQVKPIWPTNFRKDRILAC